MYRIILVLVLELLYAASAKADGWIRINQMGYLPSSTKVAVYISTDEEEQPDTFSLHQTLTDKIVYTGQAEIYNGTAWGMKNAARLNFSEFNQAGSYYLKQGETKSPIFHIATDVYEGAADFILNYMRQQRCGYNPYFKDSCHVHDGFIVDHPTRTNEIIDVKGGWHDASDYLQYLTTSANAVYQMLFAYQQHSKVFADEFDTNGLKGSNGQADILDEARWGLEWMLKMNPDSGVMFNQIADDRDHRGYRLPTKDSVSYGNDLYRPVYFITGKPQGLARHKNRTTGVSSSAGKFASSFALGARLFEETDPALSLQLREKAIDAFEFARTDLGETQTACNVSPYFYEEGNYVDDLELAAWELYQLTGKDYYLQQATYWGQLEPITPWMERGTARHYQYYPFVNLGHAQLSAYPHKNEQTFIHFMKQGLEAIYQRGKEDPFLNGIPFIWCSNNLVVAALTQARLYRQQSDDDTYQEMEAALCDWLFGCNPWGTSMICGLPELGDSPRWPHSAITYLLNETTLGGLVDGPVYKHIFENLRGVHLSGEDAYAPFQHGKAVYHDDMADYSSNEPTMDGTASLSYYLSWLEAEGIKQSRNKGLTPHLKDNQGAIIRGDTNEKNIYFIFSADEHADGADHILKVLKRKNITASFFLTGKFLRNKKFKKHTQRMINNGHYIGAHSDQHLLYNTWEKRDSLLITYDQFSEDLSNNYKELGKVGITADQAPYFLPPYEWYNKEIVEWSKQIGLKVINFTPGIGTNADYTVPGMSNYVSSDMLMNRFFKYEQINTDGLNGAIVLIHLGTHSDRSDKFYYKLEAIIDQLTANGYSFKNLQ
ncbi:MAG: glycoside hydrolase family 9 protein [Marinilabiliaceae bacterium]|nr:glycoside hydrolase family 9 protein [Marinilabiliaceae bacterium]